MGMRVFGIFPTIGVVALAACALPDADAPAESTIEQALGGTASIKLHGANAHMSLTSDTAWTLEKEGAVDPATQTVTWTVTATKGTTTTGILVINGTVKVKNEGKGGATIGNIVVNLQTRANNKWVSRSAVVADATQDDDATFARIVPSASSEQRSSFSENAASRQLLFVDGKTNSVFSLVPQVTIPGNSTRTLKFTATFDNNVLGLAKNTKTRAEIIVSFGNAGTGSGSAANLDINGNGIIDPDEKRVRSVVTRHELKVPKATPNNTTPKLTDTLADLTTTGTVTITDADFNLGPTGGTVTVEYDPGTDGGTITNCAHLRSPTQHVSCGGHSFPNVPGVDLTTCDTQTIGAPVCTPGTPGCGWQAGDVVTYIQVAWGTAASTAANLLSSQFFNVYPAGIVEIGIAGPAGFSAIFTAPSFIVTYLPASGALGPLTNDLIDPSATASGAFGGEVLALQLNVDFTAHTGGTAGIPFGSLRVCDVTPASLNGTTVSGILALANTLLGGGSPGVTIGEIAPIVVELNSAFNGGAPSTWAQDHVFNGPCP